MGAHASGVWLAASRRKPRPTIFPNPTVNPNGADRSRRRDADGSTRDACAPQIQQERSGSACPLPAPARTWTPTGDSGLRPALRVQNGCAASFQSRFSCKLLFFNALFEAVRPLLELAMALFNPACPLFGTAQALFDPATRLLEAAGALFDPANALFHPAGPLLDAVRALFEPATRMFEAATAWFETGSALLKPANRMRRLETSSCVPFPTRLGGCWISPKE